MDVNAHGGGGGVGGVSATGGRSAGGTAGRTGNGGSGGVPDVEGGAGGVPTTSNGGTEPGGAPSLGGSTGFGGGPVVIGGAGSGAGGDGPDTCADGAGRCAAGLPQTCVAGQWVPLTACGGKNPICSNGLCVGMRLTGSIVTMAGSGSSSAMRLVDHGFEYTGRSCGNVLGKTLCLSGGIVP